MKIDNGKIVEATENELYKVYLDRGMDDIVSFTEYKVMMQGADCKIVNGGAENEQADEAAM